MTKFLVFLVTLFFLQASCSSSQRYPTSDHFDGKKFFNPGRHDLKSLWQVLKWQISSDKPEWPKSMPVNHPQSLPKPANENSVLITFINHASFLIQTRNLNLLTDPIYSKRASPVTWAGPQRVYDPGVPFDLLPPIHYVLVSHNHYDHMDKATLRQLEEKHSPHVLVPLGDQKLVNEFGVQKVQELDWWE